MENFTKEGSFNTPKVDFGTDGNLSLYGRSIPEHPLKFYQPLNEWVDGFLGEKPSFVKLTIYLDYLNTHSTECVLVLMKKLNDFFSENGGDVSVEWQYDEDDEDMESLGEDLKTFVSVPFVLKPIEE